MNLLLSFCLSLHVLLLLLSSLRYYECEDSKTCIAPVVFGDCRRPHSQKYDA